MKQRILLAGTALSKAEQKTISGGGPGGGGCSSYPTYPNLSPGGYTNTACNSTADCPPNPIPGAPYMCDFGCCLYAY